MTATEAVVASVNDLQDGEKQCMEVGETEVLLIRQQGNYYAIAAHCTHYKAPLVEGVSTAGECHNKKRSVTSSPVLESEEIANDRGTLREQFPIHKSDVYSQTFFSTGWS